MNNNKDNAMNSFVKIAKANVKNQAVAYDYFVLLRPKQWTKNLLLFAGLLFSKNLFNPSLLFITVVAFIAFCLLSSAGYIINDILDAEQDRKHPAKKLRPLAAKRIQVQQAIFGSLLLLSVSLILSWYINVYFFVTSLGYLLLIFSYSYWLKHIVIFDVLAISAGFLLRAIAGAVVISVRISPWFFICTLLVSLFLALNKRRFEYVSLDNNGFDHRRVLEHYSLEFLDQLISIVTSSTILAYSLYTFTASTTEYFMLSIPFTIYGVFRYLFLVHKKGMGGSPEEVLLQDKPMLINLLLWLLFVIAVLYK